MGEDRGAFRESNEASEGQQKNPVLMKEMLYNIKVFWLCKLQRYILPLGFISYFLEKREDFEYSLGLE